MVLTNNQPPHQLKLSLTNCLNLNFAISFLTTLNPLSASIALADRSFLDDWDFTFGLVHPTTFSYDLPFRFNRCWLHSRVLGSIFFLCHGWSRCTARLNPPSLLIGTFSILGLSARFATYLLPIYLDRCYEAICQASGFLSLDSHDVPILLFGLNIFTFLWTARVPPIPAILFINLMPFLNGLHTCLVGL